MNSPPVIPAATLRHGEDGVVLLLADARGAHLLAGGQAVDRAVAHGDGRTNLGMRLQNGGEVGHHVGVDVGSEVDQRAVLAVGQQIVVVEAHAVEGVGQIAAGDADVMVVGGMENMSLAPYALPNARFGYRMNDGKVVDVMVNDGLWDAFNNYHMGITAENVAERFGVTSEMQDEFSANSQHKYGVAAAAGKFDEEIVPVMVKVKKEMVEFKVDEQPRPDSTAEKLANLKPAFKRDGGTVTAGNASGINDGAAALVIMSAEKAKELGYNVIIGNTNCDRALERDLLKSFVSMKVSGILAIPSWLENYKTIPVPLIIMSRFPYMEPYASKAHAILRPDVQYIVNDDFSGQYLAVEHLIQRGFRNNYLIIGSTEPDSAEGVMNLMRKDGYRKALADAGIAFAEDHVIENVRSIHESYRVVTQLLKSGAGRIGLCMNMDHLALAAISAAHDCGARIPEDIGLVGYDDIDSAKYMTPALTTISQSKYAIGAQSAIQVINARDGTEPWRKVLKPTLVVRRST